LHKEILERLRFEMLMGIETVRPSARVRPDQVPVTRPSPIPPPVSSGRSAPSGGEARQRPVREEVTPLPQQDTRAPAAGEAQVSGGGLFSIEDEVRGLSSEEKAARWEALEARVKACTRCPLHQGRTQAVFGDGSRTARLVFVGEAPGADEDRLGRPFVGRAGQLLDRIIAAMRLKRDEVYICNIIKCRPPENRAPADIEIQTCWPYLEEQLALLSPKIIVALGSPALKTLLKTSIGITGMRGRWQSYRGIPVMPTYHPAYVLRRYTEEIRRQVWNDMQQVMKRLKE
jgi:DNA polymerase